MLYRPLALIVVAGLTATAFASNPRLSPGSASALDLPLGFISEPCNYNCGECTLASGGKGHDVIAPDSANEANVWSAHTESCNAGSCLDAGHDCEGGGVIIGSDDAPDLSLVASFGSGELLAELVSQYAGRVVYNRDRRSIQVFCPGGAVLASVPLDARQERALHRALATATSGGQ